MPLDPQVQKVLDEAAALRLPPLHHLSPPEARQQMLDGAPPADPALSVPHVEDLRAAGPNGDIPLRLYRPEIPGVLPCVIYFHGGGWVLGNLDTHDAICHALARSCSAAVVAVDYRLAPEHRFPAAVDDSYAATTWITSHAARLGLDPGRLAVAGDSAGGNLAAVVSLLARDRSGPSLALQVLIYPITDCDLARPSYIRNARDYMLTRDLMAWFWKHYAPSDTEARRPEASPLRAGSLADLPPALVLTAEFDPLLDEGRAYAERLREAGVPVTYREYAGMIHGFFRMTGQLDRARDALDQVSDAIRRAFAS